MTPTWNTTAIAHTHRHRRTHTFDRCLHGLAFARVKVSISRASLQKAPPPHPSSSRVPLEFGPAGSRTCGPDPRKGRRGPAGPLLERYGERDILATTVRPHRVAEGPFWRLRYNHTVWPYRSRQNVSLSISLSECSERWESLSERKSLSLCKENNPYLCAFKRCGDSLESAPHRAPKTARPRAALSLCTWATNCPTTLKPLRHRSRIESQKPLSVTFLAELLAADARCGAAILGPWYPPASL